MALSSFSASDHGLAAAPLAALGTLKPAAPTPSTALKRLQNDQQSSAKNGHASLSVISVEDQTSSSALTVPNELPLNAVTDRKPWCCHSLRRSCRPLPQAGLVLLQQHWLRRVAPHLACPGQRCHGNPAHMQSHVTGLCKHVCRHCPTCFVLRASSTETKLSVVAVLGLLPLARCFCSTFRTMPTLWHILNPCVPATTRPSCSAASPHTSHPPLLNHRLGLP